MPNPTGKMPMPKGPKYGPGKGGSFGKPNPDDKIVRTMPITMGQLKQIKKHYGIQ